MYSYYECFQYGNSSTLFRSRTVHTFKVSVHSNPQPSLIKKMLKLHGRDAKLNTKSGKLYVRVRIREARVCYSRDRQGATTLIGSYVKNFSLGILKGLGCYEEDYCFSIRDSFGDANSGICQRDKPFLRWVQSSAQTQR